jgi:hypothetical protein
MGKCSKYGSPERRIYWQYLACKFRFGLNRLVFLTESAFMLVVHRQGIFVRILLKWTPFGGGTSLENLGKNSHSHQQGHASGLPAFTAGFGMSSMAGVDHLKMGAYPLV